MFKSIVFSTTYQCPIECRYCGAECGPGRTERLTLQEMIKIIDSVEKYGELRLVVFTGGEPFLLGDDLLRCVEYCSAKGILTRIVTNAFWATNPQTASKIVGEYKKAGLTEMNVSCDDYHQEFIPLEQVKYAHDACVDADIPILLAHKIMKGYKISMEYLDEYFGRPLERFDSEKKNPDNYAILSSYNVPIAEDMHLIADEEILYPPQTDEWKGVCSSALQRIIITPLKELSVCCGMIPRKVQEILFGTLDEFSLEELILQAQNDLFVNWLALEGPYSIMKFILQKDSCLSFREKYVNICHLCSEIFTREDCRGILSEHAHEKTNELWMKQALYNVFRDTEIPDEEADISQA